MTDVAAVTARLNPMIRKERQGGKDEISALTEWSDVFARLIADDVIAGQLQYPKWVDNYRVLRIMLNRQHDLRDMAQERASRG